jgi:exonuclease V gamma subunit
MAKGRDQPKAAVKKSAEQEVKDKMFGMKNKASKKKLEAQLLASAKAGNSRSETGKAQRAAEERKREKQAQEDAKRELESVLNKPAQVQKAPFGVDPKTIVCIFFKKGDCEKGNRCKFSHDLSIDRKTIKKDVYQDTREAEEEQKRQETSDDWDEEKLKTVILSKKGNQQTTTDKVCKFFISAIEDGKYGWFWVCPNGGDKCKYKHALPPGCVFVVVVVVVEVDTDSRSRRVVSLFLPPPFLSPTR